MMELNLKSTAQESGTQRNVKGVVTSPTELVTLLGEFVRMTLSNQNLGIRIVSMREPQPEKGGDNDFSFDRN